VRGVVHPAATQQQKPIVCQDRTIIINRKGQQSREREGEGVSLLLIETAETKDGTWGRICCLDLLAVLSGFSQIPPSSVCCYCHLFWEGAYAAFGFYGHYYYYYVGLIVLSHANYLWLPISFSPKKTGVPVNSTWHDAQKYSMKNTSVFLHV